MPRSLARNIVVLGGGTAGYFAALGIRRWFPDVTVTVVESSKIPIIGVGEATTPPLVSFLHHFLGIDIHRLQREVKPTWKLGIHFDWGPPGGFDYPFLPEDVASARHFDGSLARASLGAMLMHEKRVPLVRTDDDRVVSALHQVRFAYHLNNAPFVRFLAAEAARANIGHLDAEVADIELRDQPDGPAATAILLTDGRRLEVDFVVDCTGFRSVVLGKKLGSRFTSYGDTLYCDRAVVADVPHDGTIKPYTRAESMDAGWCWNIPMVDIDHRGYVYSSQFLSQDQAVAEMRAKNPAMSEPRFVSFVSGRHEDFWLGNIVAVGNSYGFVEPLESTALHMVIIEVTRLVRLLDLDREGTEDRDRAVVNRRIGAHWDYLRWFLGVHYRFNQRSSTPFWQHCREHVNISGFEDVLADFRAHGSLSERRAPVSPDSIFHAGGIDTMLIGQEVDAPSSSSLTREQWETRSAERKRFVDHALDHRAALEWLAQHPEAWDAFVGPDSWCAEYGRKMLE